jgi:hypothetical protein
MKIYHSVLIAGISLIFLTGFSQEFPSKFQITSQGSPQDSPTGGSLTCPDNSIFSQPSRNAGELPYAYTSDVNYSPYPSYLSRDDFWGLTAPISAVDFWGLTQYYSSYIYHNCTNEIPMTFKIIFYTSNSYGHLGTLVYQESFQLTGEYIDYAGASGYHFRANLSSPVNLSSGWISIQGTSTGTPTNCIFMWIDSATGNNNACMNNQNMYDNLAFCLSSSTGEEPSVPISPWALMLAIMLIGGSVAFRYLPGRFH